MLVVNAEGTSHVLSPKLPSRVLFVAEDGSVLGHGPCGAPCGPDSGSDHSSLDHQCHLDLHGESPEVARTLLMRMVDRAVLSGPSPR